METESNTLNMKYRPGTVVVPMHTGGNIINGIAGEPLVLSKKIGTNGFGHDVYVVVHNGNSFEISTAEFN
jgi:hypothetical protein